MSIDKKKKTYQERSLFYTIGYYFRKQKRPRPIHTTVSSCSTICKCKKRDIKDKEMLRKETDCVIKKLKNDKKRSAKYWKHTIRR